MSPILTIRSPFDDQVVGEVPTHTVDDLDVAVERAVAAFRARALPAHERHQILGRAAAGLAIAKEELARTICDEAAKPISLARVEVERAQDTFAAAAATALQTAGEVLPFDAARTSAGKLGYTVRVPRGVVGAISPFNFPLNLVSHKVAPAIAAGCPVVLKPASQTPMSALALARVLYEAGLPEDWLHVVVGGGSTIGNALVDHPDVPTISFTGSSSVGWEIPRRAPRKHVALELGNSTPVIVHADGAWEDAARATATAGYGFAGQSCISVQRAYVHRSIEEAFVERLSEEIGRLQVGDPRDPATATSALISTKERDRVRSALDAAVAQGARLRRGGEIDGTLLSPALITDAEVAMGICQEEVFGPVVAVQAYDAVEEAIALANGTRYGLQAGIYTSDIRLALRATTELDFGGVLVNEVPTWRADLMPYGGTKDSGNTREGPKYAIEHMTERKLVVLSD